MVAKRIPCDTKRLQELAMRTTQKNILFRLTDELHQFLKAEAKKNERSINSQLTIWVKEKMHEQQKIAA